MRNFPITPSDLTLYRSKEEYIRQTAEQVIKDFAMFGLDIHFSGNAFKAYDELFQQVKEQLDILAGSNPEKLHALLYQIDLNEYKGILALPGDADESAGDQLARRVLEREFLKVVIRNYFKEKGV